MIKDNQKRLNRVHVLLDALITILAYALAWFVVISGRVMDTPGAPCRRGFILRPSCLWCRPT